MARRRGQRLAAFAVSFFLSLSSAAGDAAKVAGVRAPSRPILMRYEERSSPAAHTELLAVSFDGASQESSLASSGDVPVDAAQRAAAQQLVTGTNSGGLVSYSRKVATVELAMKALSIQGDFVETGVFNGGTAILMGKVMLPHAADGKVVRTLWLADSFQGLPADAEPASVANKSNASGQSRIAGLKATSTYAGGAGNFSFSRKAFDDNLRAFGMFGDPHIKVLQGWFKDTLPKAPIGSIAFLRLDGDIFASTMDSIANLYDKVAANGYIYVDDYGAYKGCKDAIDSFRRSHNIQDTMYPVDEHNGHYEAVWWRKSA